MSTGNVVADVDLSCALSRASYSLATEVTAALAEIGLTQRTYSVLNQALAGEYTQIRLAEVCQLDKTTMVNTIDEMERDDLVARRPSTTDRRARIIVVTPVGRDAATRAADIVAALYADVLAAIPADERASFVRNLALLADGRLGVPVPCDRMPRRPK
jgi:MarR family transcriptional regulator, transcriptional regulator for hemolysin